jgi:hypothetical protein
MARLGLTIVSTKFCQPANIILFDQHLEYLTKPMFLRQITLLLVCLTARINEPISKSHHNHRFSLEKLVSFGDRKGSAEASALRPCAGGVAGLHGWRWGRKKLLQSLEDLGSPFLVEAHTDQHAGAVVDRPVAPILPNRHRGSPLRKRGTEHVPCPRVALLAFAPAVRRPMGPPGAAVFVVLRHLHAVLAAPAWALPALKVPCALRG